MVTFAKSLSPEQVAFLSPYVPEFQSKTDSGVRGDAKALAVNVAEQFIAKYGLPEGHPQDSESIEKYKDQIHTWFQSQLIKVKKKRKSKPKVAPTAEDSTQALPPPQNMGYEWNGNNSPASTSQVHSPSSRAPLAVNNLNLNLDTIRDTFLSAAVDAATLSAAIQTYTRANPSPTPLSTVVAALFSAITCAETQFIPQFMPSPNGHPPQHPPQPHTAFSLLQRYYDACTYFPPSLSHAGDMGPNAGHRALLMDVRQHSVWNAFAPALQVIPTPLAPMADEMKRIQHDRVRRNDHLRWARIHAIAMELGMLNAGRALSEMMVRDCPYATDEIEWDAGVVVLRAIIRTSMPGDARQNKEYSTLLNLYEGRWRDIKDETRQSMVTQVIIGAKDDLARLDMQPHPHSLLPHPPVNGGGS